MDIVIFGIGKYFASRRAELRKIMPGKDSIVAFIDNKISEPKEFSGLPLLNPRSLSDLSFDIVLLMSASANEMREQLLKLHVATNKILTHQEYVVLARRNDYKLRLNKIASQPTLRVLLVHNTLKYDGGAMCVLYAAHALIARGHEVWVMAPDADENFLHDLDDGNVNVILYQNLSIVRGEDLSWLPFFDVVLVNVFHMIRAACEISKNRKAIWWLHEPSQRYCDVYGYHRKKYTEYDNTETMKNLRILAVSNIAKRNFEEFYPGRIDGLLTYGMPDKIKQLDIKAHDLNKPIVIAVIGVVYSLKGIDVFVKAACKVIATNTTNVEFRIIGRFPNDDYTAKFSDAIAENKQIKVCGILTRDEMREAFNQIDIVVCSSLEETMSLTITEGMMCGKVCITTDNTGIADFIEDGVNGFVCRAGDANSLSEKMQYAIENFDNLIDMRRNARQTYEKYFTLENFGERLERELLKVRKKDDKQVR